MPDNIVPDIYFDRFDILVDAVGVTISLALSGPPLNGQAPITQTKALFRTSLENWKAMMMTGKKQLKAHEQQHNVKVQLPKALMDGLGLSEDQW